MYFEIIHPRDGISSIELLAARPPIVMLKLALLANYFLNRITYLPYQQKFKYCGLYA